jgi:energy-coupling factor transporter transmembrane protein EcfT
VQFHVTDIQSVFTDLGGSVGFGIFGVILAGMGFIFTWRYKRRFLPLYVLLLFLIVYIFNFSTEGIVYLNIIFAYLGAIGLHKLLLRRWNLDLMKSLTILIIILGLLFSGLSYINRVSRFPPYPTIADSLDWLKQNSDNSEIVFSHHSKGFWIEYFAEREPLTNNYNYKELISDSELIFQSRNLKNTTLVLDKHNISYIWIDGQMQNGQVWEKEEQGLLFLFKNNETFKNIYSRDNIYIWKYMKWEE